MQYQTGVETRDRMPWWRSGRTSMLTRAESALANWALVDDHQAVLELGLTDGTVLDHLMNRYNIRACGACFDADTAQNARQRLLGAEVMYTLPDDIPWRNNSFDRVLVTQPLPARLDCGGWTAEVLRTLKPGGRLLMALPILKHDGTAGSLRERYVRPKDLLKKLSTCGFDDVSYRYAFAAHAILTAGKPI